MEDKNNNTMPEMRDGSTPAGNTNPTPEEEKSMGPIIGSIIIIIILVLGGLYIWGQRTGQLGDTLPPPPPAPTNVFNLVADDPYTENLEQQGTSTEVDDIDADLEAESFSELDADLNEADAELQEL